MICHLIILLNGMKFSELIVRVVRNMVIEVAVGENRVAQFDLINACETESMGANSVVVS